MCFIIIIYDQVYMFLQLQIEVTIILVILLIYSFMIPKKKIEHVSYGITKNEASYQIAMVELMSKLLNQTRQNNYLLRRCFEESDRTNYRTSNPTGTAQKMRKDLTGVSFYPESRNYLLPSRVSHETNPFDKKNIEENDQKQSELIANPHKKIEQSHNNDQESDVFKRLVQDFQSSLLEVTKVNKQISDKLGQLQRPQEATSNPIILQQSQQQLYEKTLMNILEKRDKVEKKSYGHYGIISQVMPFSDKREIKVRYKIADLMNQSEVNQNFSMDVFKQNTTEWIGQVFRATASICWNMLYGGQLSFDEVKVLFTENIIFNFIEYMKDIQSFINEEKKLQLTNHINYISCEVLQFLCRQYPQTKIQAPNVALRKSIPLIQNQGQSKFDLVTMVCKDSLQNQDDSQIIEFKVREDKDYSSTVMKMINYMIDHTQAQYPHFEKLMTNIFEKMYIQKERRNKLKADDPVDHSKDSGMDSQYRQKVKAYSSYLIGRKIPKNTPKYTKSEIQYGVFFVKAPSTLRIITKWFQQLWQFVNTPLEKLKTATSEIKDHSGNVLNISTRVKHLLFQRVNDNLDKIKMKIQKLRTECYNMELLLANSTYTQDLKQMHLSEDQLSVGKYCSNLKNAISSYVCSQLSKVIYFLLRIPKAIDQKVLDFNDEDFQEQARKHLDNTNLVTLRIFDLLRCKCHSNEEEIMFIVEALKQLDRDDDKFEIVRVKDRLNQGTRDILINAQYDGGLVWEIQLAVTTQVDKKQDLLDKYNHFLYELKRNKLGPISQCVSIWSSLEQRSIYFEELILRKKSKGAKCVIQHKGKQCKEGDLSEFSQFKRPIICIGCKEYYAIPVTSLLNVRCEQCRITYCGICFYLSLSDLEKKRFMFQNYNKKKLLNNNAFQELEEYTDYRKPLPKQGFFIKKKFLNRELSFYSICKLDRNDDKKDEFVISLSQLVIRKGYVEIRPVNKKELRITEKDGEYFLKGSDKELRKSELNDLWLFSFKSKQSQNISVEELEAELRDVGGGKMKYLNVLFQPNYMSELRLYSKIFEKVRLINNVKAVEEISKYRITVYRFPNLTVLAQPRLEEKELQQLLVKRANLSTLKSFAEKKMTVLNMEQTDLSDEITSLINIETDDIAQYLIKVQKLYLADNCIDSISCFKHFKNLATLSISKNYLSSLEGIEELTKLYYLKFDENSVKSLIPLRKLVNLTYISANINQITSLEGLEKLEHLGSLSICQNKLTAISELGGLKKLKRLYIRDNPIGSILPINHIPMKHLYIGNTSIDPLQLTQLSSITLLKEISLKNMKIEVIPKIFENTLHLVELKLSKNKIKKIENLWEAVNLERLDLSDNEIEVMENLETLESLEMLNLKNNKIRVVEKVKTYIECLKTLHLENNPLDDLTDYLMYEEKPALLMRLKFTEQSMTAKAREQLKSHSFEVGSKSESDG